MSKVLVIVVTYNGLPWLERCLSSVISSEVEKSLFVWDNASTDGSADYVAEHFPQAHIVRSGENALFARPNNEGLRWALDHGYDYAYLLNQDAWLEPGALETLLKAASEHPEYAVLSPLQLAPDGSLDKNFEKILRLASLAQNDKIGSEGDTRSRISGHPRLCKREGPEGDVDSPTCATLGTIRGRGPREVPEARSLGRGREATVGESISSAGPVPAAHWLVNLAAVRQIGLFNEELFPLYGQDDDWCNRARYHGYKIGIIEEAKGVHDRAQRKEPKEKLIERNYRSASLVRLADINRPLWASSLYVCLYTLVKAVKYVSLKPIGLFFSICRLLPAVKSARLAGRRGGLGFVE